MKLKDRRRKPKPGDEEDIEGLTPVLSGIPEDVIKRIEAGKSVKLEAVEGLPTGTRTELSVFIVQHAKSTETTAEQNAIVCKYLHLLCEDVRNQITGIFDEKIRHALHRLTVLPGEYSNPLGYYPHLNTLAEKAELPREYIVKHLQPEKANSLYAEQLTGFQMLIPNVLSALYHTAITQRDVRAARLFLESVGTPGQQAPRTINARQTNYIQANNYQIEAIINALPPEAREQVNTIILNAMQPQPISKHFGNEQTGPES